MTDSRSASLGDWTRPPPASAPGGATPLADAFRRPGRFAVAGLERRPGKCLGLPPLKGTASPEASRDADRRRRTVTPGGVVAAVAEGGQKAEATGGARTADDR